jgi:hypothetical protein
MPTPSAKNSRSGVSSCSWSFMKAADSLTIRAYPNARRATPHSEPPPRGGSRRKRLAGVSRRRKSIARTPTLHDTRFRGGRHSPGLTPRRNKTAAHSPPRPDVASRPGKYWRPGTLPSSVRGAHAAKPFSDPQPTSSRRPSRDMCPACSRVIVASRHERQRSPTAGSDRCGPRIAHGANRDPVP